VSFWQDRVADVGLLALGVALPCVVVGYFTLMEGRPSRREAEVPGEVPAEVAAEVVAAPRVESVPGSSVEIAAPAGAEQPAAASGVTGADSDAASVLAARAVTLLSPDPGLRAETIHALSHLDNDARTAVVARLDELSVQRPAADDVARVFNALRRAADSKQTDENVDLVAAVPALLERERTSEALAVTEPLLYMRSLETMVGAEGQPDLARFVELDDGAWEAELARVRKRLGTAFVPTLITLRAHASQRVRKFALAQLAAIGGEDPKAILSGTDPYGVARAVRAYASPPDYVAMPTIVRLVGDSRIQVRQAAREAVARFGRNAIWQVRELYDEVAGQPADKRLDHEQTARELYAVLDRPRLEEAETLLARGLQSLTRGDLGAMRRDYDALLAKYPDFEHRDRLAEGYAVLAADLFRHDSLAASLATYRRALRLAPEAPTAKQWSARVAFVSAELSLTRGVVDLTGYTRALALDPQLREAHDAIERLSGTRTQHERDMKRLAALIAFALLLTCVVLLLRRAPTDRADVAAGAAALPETESEPSG
jgi:tetratricopeptide (TPR) repeat protein